MKLKYKILIVATLITSTFFICGTKINTLKIKNILKKMFI